MLGKRRAELRLEQDGRIAGFQAKIGIRHPHLGPPLGPRSRIDDLALPADEL